MTGKEQAAWRLGQIARMAEDGMAEDFDLQARENILAEYGWGKSELLGNFGGWDAAALCERFREAYHVRWELYEEEA